MDQHGTKSVFVLLCSLTLTLINFIKQTCSHLASSGTCPLLARRSLGAHWGSPNAPQVTNGSLGALLAHARHSPGARPVLAQRSQNTQLMLLQCQTFTMCQTFNKCLILVSSEIIDVRQSLDMDKSWTKFRFLLLCFQIVYSTNFHQTEIGQPLDMD